MFRNIQSWPAHWIKGSIHGKPITSLEYQIICDHFNAKEKDNFYTVSMNIQAIKNLLSEPALLKSRKSTKKSKAKKQDASETSTYKATDYDERKVRFALVCL